MCATNAFGDSSCHHGYDKIDREILSIIGIYGSNGGITVHDIFHRMTPSSRDRAGWRGKRLVSHRLQTLERDGYVKGDGLVESKFPYFYVPNGKAHMCSASAWHPTNKLQSKLLEVVNNG